MAKKALPPTKFTEDLMELMWSPHIKDNPYAWVMMAFPWGEKGPLQNHQGPREWQRRELLLIADFIKENKRLIAQGKNPKVYKRAISAGRGPGKSTLAAWLNLWMMSCHIGSTSIVTANTDTQLTDKTFGEIGRWQTLAVNNYWFDRIQKGVNPAPWFVEAMKEQLHIDNQHYYIKGVLWNEDNTDAFAGAHSPVGMFLTFDEASGIPEPIWKVSDGFFTDLTPYRFWFAFSNPRSNSGAFYDCFHSHSQYWTSTKIDCRQVEGLDQATYEEIIEKYGEDSREARIEVKGEFPEQGDRQFISRSVVEDACRRELSRQDDYAPLCMGIDVARFGDDSTCIFFRQGRDARSIPPVILRGADNMTVANTCAQLIDKYDPDGVFCDAGAGSGVIDRLREMKYHIHEVTFGSAPDADEYFDHRSEIWGRVKDWLQGAMLENQSKEGRRLVEELVGPEYDYVGREGKIKLESKDSMKKRLPKLGSPDIADALAVTFHCPVSARGRNASRMQHVPANRRAKGVGSDVSFDGYNSSGAVRKAHGTGSDVNFD